LGSTPEEKVFLSQLKGFLADFESKFWDFSYRGVPEKLEEDKAELKKDFTVRLEKLEKFLGKKDFLVGKITVLDLLVFDFLTIIFDFLFPEFAAHFKGLKALVNRVGAIDSIKKYRESPRFFKTQLNGPQARYMPLKM
jgi:glutathione S-transferase